MHQSDDGCKREREGHDESMAVYLWFCIGGVSSNV